MTLGEHLDEFRRRLLRIVIGVVLGMAVALCFGEGLFKVMFWPLAMATGGQPPALHFKSLPEAFSSYLRVCLIAGAILASPYGLYQLWRFVAVGLYPNERRAVRKILVPSVALFAAGVAFFLVVVAPMVMHFFLSFARKGYPLPPQWGLGFLHKYAPPATQAARAAAGDGGFVQPVLMLGEYVSFVSMLSLVFGLAFQTPLVVIFLSASGIVPISAMRRFRKYVFLGILIVSAVATPSDVGSMIALAAPMYGLYEIGLLIAAWKRKPAEA